MKKTKRKAKRRYWNDQLWFECQLVTVWNAAIYHGAPVPERYGDEYMRDCEMALAISGPALVKDHVVRKAGLRPVEGRMTWDWVSRNLPCELSIFCKRGFHSVLAVDVDRGRRRLAVTNLHRGRIAWVAWRDLKGRWPKRVSSARPRKWVLG